MNKEDIDIEDRYEIDVANVPEFVDTYLGSNMWSSNRYSARLNHATVAN